MRKSKSLKKRRFIKAILPLTLMAYLIPSMSSACVNPMSIQTNQYLDVNALIHGTKDLSTSPILINVKPPHLNLKNIYHYNQVRSALIYNNANLEVGSLVITSQPDGGFVALVDTPEKQGVVIGQGDGQQVFKEDSEDASNFIVRDMIGNLINQQNFKALAAPQIDKQGNTVITVDAGFSDRSAAAIGTGPNHDTVPYALAQVESVNVALKNSLVDNVLLELKGTEQVSRDYPITTNTLHLLQQGKIFSNPKKAALVAGFFGDKKVSGGWGDHKRYSIVGVGTSIGFRHEVGHNAGGHHCNPDLNTNRKFNYGFDAGNSQQTIMCGNKLPNYSNPYVLDRYGNPLGKVDFADMARVWRGNAVRMSSYDGTAFLNS